MLTGIAPSTQTQPSRPDWRAAFRAATQNYAPARDNFLLEEEPSDMSVDARIQTGKISGPELMRLAASGMRIVPKTSIHKDTIGNGIDDEEEENNKNDGFLSEIQNQKLFEGIYNGLIRPDTLSHNKQGYLAHDGVNLTLAHKQEIEDIHKVCLAGRTADEIDPATGKAYVVDEKTGLTKITMDDINKIRLGSTSLARDDNHQSRIAKTFSDARDYKGAEPLDNPSYHMAAPRLAFSPAPSAPVAAPQ